MQVNPQEVSGAKASTARTRPTMASQRLDLPSLCDICGKARSTRKHQECSRVRQQIKQEEWASYMANVAAKKAQRGRRHA
ncbi:hypothetical protein N7402_00785 [Pseudomonas aeruginosa]|uniref:hypothetical protein n=1 Tax=Pseudomonas aeruginosa TaxID=287 RepID=UPI00244BC34D|nr:hypothetical protein [Pseudomonas aeruginosa]MDH0373917.1 hypothetical protein [Pseudomonas aeruginosa]